MKEADRIYKIDTVDEEYEQVKTKEEESEMHK